MTTTIEDERTETTMQRWKIAVHESSHAVIGHYLGLPICGILVTDAGGYVSHGPARDATLFSELLSKYAGPASEYLASKHQPPATTPPTQDAAKHDAVFTDKMSAAPKRRSDSETTTDISDTYFAPGFRAAAREELQRLATIFVEQHEVRIVTLAEHLYVNGTIATDAIEEFLGAESCRAKHQHF
jgi:hypothetical protein